MSICSFRGCILAHLCHRILTLRILKIHNIGLVGSLLYSGGLSVAFVMFTGAFANFALPFIGISRHILILPITAMLATFTLILCAVAHKRDRDFPAASKGFNISEITQLPYLFLFLLPSFVIFGARLFNLCQNNSCSYRLSLSFALSWLWLLLIDCPEIPTHWR